MCIRTCVGETFVFAEWERLVLVSMGHNLGLQAESHIFCTELYKLLDTAVVLNRCFLFT